MANTATLGTDTVPYFRGGAAGYYRSWNNLINDLGLTVLTSDEQTTIANMTALSNGVVVKTGTTTYAARDIIGSSVAGSQGITVSNIDGVAGNPTIALNIHGLSSVAVTGSGEIAFYDGTNNRKRAWRSIITDLRLITATSATFRTNPVKFPRGTVGAPSITVISECNL